MGYENPPLPVPGMIGLSYDWLLQKIKEDYDVPDDLQVYSVDSSLNQRAFVMRGISASFQKTKEFDVLSIDSPRPRMKVVGRPGGVQSKRLSSG